MYKYYLVDSDVLAKDIDVNILSQVHMYYNMSINKARLVLVLQSINQLNVKVRYCKQ